MANIDNKQDVMDSRDIIARIEELESEIESLKEEETEKGDIKASERFTELQELEAELKPLKALADECEGYSDWNHGETLIRDSYFKEYAQELAEDTGATKKEVSWPYTCIDWDWAAKELQYDYTSVDFDGVTYWIRSC